MKKAKKIILDTNIWVSYIIGRRLDEISRLILDNNLTVFICQELEDELEEVLRRDKFTKLIHFEPGVYIQFIKKLTHSVRIFKEFDECADKKDNYLFDLAAQSGTEYFVTGDKMLLKYKIDNLKMLSFQQFRDAYRAP